MKNLILSCLLFLVTSACCEAQNSAKGFKVDGHINGFRDSTLILAHWYGSASFYPKDTAVVDAQGNFIFQGEKSLPQGLYLVIPPSKKDIGLHLILTDDQTFSVNTDLINIVKNMVVSGSTENELFYAYQQQLNKFSEEAKAIQVNEKSTRGTIDTTTAKQQLTTLGKRLKEYQGQFLTRNTNTFAAKLFRATTDPVIPETPTPPSGIERADSNWVFTYYKAHYWDGYDWSDERLMRTPVLQDKLNRYIKELTVQTVDSLVKESDWLVGKAKANKEVMSYVIWYITSQYERPKVLGTDGVFIHMAETYWLTGIYPVSDSTTLETIRERVAILKPLQIGKPFPVFMASDTLGRNINLQTLRADYTLVFFYAPHCGHCRDTAPKLKALADRYKDKGVQTVAIAVDDSEADWKKFIQEFKLSGFTHGYDLTHTMNFQRQYDVAMTPTIYVLDKDKKIIARQLPFEQVEDFILFYQRQHGGTSINESKTKNKS